MQQTEQLPTYNAYSIDGDVTAPLVYVNYGVPADYDELEERGIDVKGQDRHRPLRRFVARHQAEGRGRTRRRRLHDLFRSARRRLLSGRCLSERCVAQRERRSAWLGHGHAALSRRSADKGIGATKDAKRIDRKGRADADENSGPADLLRRCFAAAQESRRCGRARSLARRSADDLSLWRQDADRAYEARVQLGHQADLRRDRRDARQRAAGRMDHSRQSSRRLGQRCRRSAKRPGRDDGRSTRHRRACKDRLEAKADDRLLPLGRRRRRACSARPNGSRRTPTN